MKKLFLLFSFAMFLNVGVAHASQELDHGVFKRYSYETRHYRIEFSELLMQQNDSDRNGLPDIVDVIAEAAEYSHGVLMDTLKYQDPMDGDPLLIILDDTDQYLTPSALGVTSLLSNGDPFVAVDPWMSEEYLQVTIGHELFHTVQFGYGADFAYTYPGINWAESTATWVEDVEYDDINDYVNYLSDFFDYPDYSVFASITPSGSLFEYGLNIWPRFLAENYGNGIIKSIWENYVESDDSYDSDLKLYNAVKSIIEDRGEDFNEVFRQFTLWNLDLDQYEEGNSYPDVLILDGDTDDSYQEINSSYAPALYGTNYIYFENTNRDDSFYFHIQKPEGVSFAVTLVPYERGAFDLVHSTSLMIDQDEDMEEALELPNLSDSAGVVAVVSPLDTDFSTSLQETDFDEAYSYNFQAIFGDADESVTVENINTSDTTETKDGETSDGSKGDLNQLILSVVSYNEDSVSLSWNRLVKDSVASYVLHYGTEEDDLQYDKVIPQAYTISTTVTGLEEGQTYYFELESYNSNGVAVVDPSSIVTVVPESWIFSDVSYLNDYYSEISALVDEGVFQGYPDGSFQPDATINRAELLKILIEGQGYTPSAQNNSCFSDVGKEWFAKYVCYAKEQGWVNGYDDGSFRPGEPVNKVEALKMLFNVYNAGLQEGESVSELPYGDLSTKAWYSIYVDQAASLGILEEEPDTDFDAGVGRSRAEMALELYRYLVVTGVIGD